MIVYHEALVRHRLMKDGKKSVKVVLTCAKKITRHTGEKSIAWFLSL